MLRFLVYGLTDPRTDEIRYIGKSSTGMRRPHQHDKPSYLRDDVHRVRWIKQLIALGATYGIVILDICANNADVLAAEIRWIAIGRAAGWPLTNCTDGGEGLIGMKHSEATKKKIAAVHRGRVKNPEHRAAIADTLRGSTASPESRAKRSIATKARVASTPGEHDRLARLRLGARNSDRAREKLRAANLGLVHSQERRDKNAAARRGRKRSRESIEKQAATLCEYWATRWINRRRSTR
jgi:hypothetical protein